MKPEDSPENSRPGRLVVAAVVLAVVLLAVFSLPLDSWLTSAAEWNRAHPLAGAGLFVLAATLAGVLFVPGSVIAMSAGFVYGLPVGACLAIVGLTTGGFAAFVAGRSLVRDWVFGKMQSNPKLAALDRAVYDKSFMIVALTRLSLILPFNVLNYVYGVTGVKKLPYILGTAVGMIPAAVLYTYVGTLAKNFDDIRSGNLDSGLPGGYVLGGGLIMITLAVVIVHRTASRALNERLAE